jgi:hypothetical protein
MENVEASARTVGAPPPVMVEVTALTRLRLDELVRLRAIGMEKAMELRSAREGLMSSPLVTPEQRFQLHMRYVDRFDRIGRAVRQIMTLEFELLGLFEAPDRDAFPKLRKIKPELGGALARPWLGIGQVKPITLDDVKDLGVRPDYRVGPMEDVVAGIRRTLGAEPPANDPFAPRPERKPRAAAPAPNPPSARLPPATVKLPAKPPVNHAFEAAVYALADRLDIGLRVSSATPRHPLAPPPHAPQGRHNRGPPK